MAALAALVEVLRMAGQAPDEKEPVRWSGYAQFGTHQGLSIVGVGILAGARRTPEVFEFKQSVEQHLAAGDLALFRRLATVEGIGPVHIIGCLVPYRDSFGRSGFAGSAVALDDTVETMHHALGKARQLLDDLLERGPAQVLVTTYRGTSGDNSPRIQSPYDPHGPAFHLDQGWEHYEQSQLASLLKHCCQHPDLSQRSVLILDRPSGDSRPFDWRFFEASRRALSERLEDCRHSEQRIAALKTRAADLEATLQAERFDAQDRIGELEAENQQINALLQQETRRTARAQTEQREAQDRIIQLQAENQRINTLFQRELHRAASARMERGENSAHREQGGYPPGAPTRSHRHHKPERSWYRHPVGLAFLGGGTLAILLVIFMLVRLFTSDEASLPSAPDSRDTTPETEQTEPHTSETPAIEAVPDPSFIEPREVTGDPDPIPADDIPDGVTDSTLPPPIDNVEPEETRE